MPLPGVGSSPARSNMFALLLGCLVPQVQQLSELLDFTEQERLTLLEKEAALQQELEQVGTVPPSGVWRSRQAALGAETGQKHHHQISQLYNTAISIYWMQAEILHHGTSPTQARVSRAHCKCCCL